MLSEKCGFIESSQLSKAAGYDFSFLTPLNGCPSDFTSMNRPVFVSRLTQCPEGVWVCERSRTAPLR